MIGNALVASGGTASAALEIPGGGYELVAVVVPTIDSSTVTFSFSYDSGATYLTAFTNSGVPAALTLGSADVGAKVVGVPEGILQASVGASHMKLTLAAQAGGARVLPCIFRKIAT
ncbi:MAG: hypothetical protein H0U59_00870 [Gemmatimonadaceae bacterium]|nr:hypothetical protein [Gemmatimonadaceae bacterium]